LNSVVVVTINLLLRHCEEPATKLRSNFALERRSNPVFCFWIASVSALARCAGLTPGEACNAREAGSLSLAMTDIGLSQPGAKTSTQDIEGRKGL
jgi:hypothetical protein